MCCTRAAELDSSKRQLGGTRPSGLRSVPCTFLPRRNHHSNRCSRKMRSKFISSLGLKAHRQSTLSTRNHHVDFSCRSSRRGANCCTLQSHLSSLKRTVVTIITSSLSCACAAPSFTAVSSSNWLWSFVLRPNRPHHAIWPSFIAVPAPTVRSALGPWLVHGLPALLHHTREPGPRPLPALALQGPRRRRNKLLRPRCSRVHHPMSGCS
mmetsp:Transcript_55524/g.149772  ORF Transcript_55524/g.149772 Transcript_55524/m.149772 type:complete len:209 (-) Transcript_55524:687-1313(-)